MVDIQSVAAETLGEEKKKKKKEQTTA